jgi:putative hemolysin
MVNKKNWLGILAIVLVFGMAVVGCIIPEDEAEIEPGKEGTIVVYSENGHSYQMFDRRTTWSRAKKYCEEKGGYLATITSSDEQEFIVSLLQKEGQKNVYWVGGYCGSDRVFKWVTGEPFVYDNSFTPDNYGGKEDKLQIYRHNGFWNDSEDVPDPNETWWYEVGFICEWD